MKLGVVFPQTEIGLDPAAIKDYAQTVEGMGFDYLLTYEHVLGANPNRPGKWPGPYTYKHTFHEPFVLFGYLAALTQNIEFVNGIVILPQRQTALLAKQAAQVDLLSGGRLRVGIGVGWNKVEMEGMGFDFKTRGKRVEEQIDLLRHLWTEPLVKFKGDFHTIDDAGINPLPVQRPIPLWIGGMADVTLKRAARVADGWLPNRTSSKNNRREVVDKMLGYLADAGRSSAQFGIDARVTISDTTWEAQVNDWREAGATHLCVNTMGAGFTSLQQHLEAIGRFKDYAEG